MKTPLLFSSFALLACSNAGFRDVGEKCAADSQCLDGLLCEGATCQPPSVLEDGGWTRPMDGGTVATAQDGGFVAPIGTLFDGGTNPSDGGSSVAPKVTTSVGPAGGVVDKLLFAVTGDTRPKGCDNTAGYPASVISSIASAIDASGAQFVVDLGDHMNVCMQSASIANAQMSLYMHGASNFRRTWFMTMGNHECQHGGNCAGVTNDVNYNAYLTALAPISALPYYSFDVQTTAGLAIFAIIADDAWDTKQEAWLDQVLTRADRLARYTFAVRHHPVVGRSGPQGPVSVIERHHYSLIITGHDHHYHHDFASTHGGRDVVVGLGGASLADTGFGTIGQNSDGTLQFTLFDATGNPQNESWSVAP